MIQNRSAGTNSCHSSRTSSANNSPMGSPSSPRKIARRNSSNSLFRVDLAPYVGMSLSKAAEKLGVPASTLGKKWREVTKNRKWYESIN